jgi:5-formyltetrahydrofolate cyclo-ligase
VTLDSDRSELRQRLRAVRTCLTPQQRIAAAAGVVASLEQLPEFMVDSRIAGYWAVAGELSLHAALGGLLARDQRYHLPALAQQNMLRFVEWRPGVAVQPNRYGIPEPEHDAATALAPIDLDVVLMPLLGFDRRGHRIGSGAGYYDRSFAFLRATARPAKPILVGIGYSLQELPSIASATWDVALDYVATERELIDCNVGGTAAA